MLLTPAMEGHGECDIKVQLNCSHCQTQSCKREEDTHLILCLCDEDEVLASDNVTCIGTVGMYLPMADFFFLFDCRNSFQTKQYFLFKPVNQSSRLSLPAAPQGLAPQGQMSTTLILAVVVSTVASGIALVCAGVILSKRILQFCAQSVPSTFHRL